MMIWPYMPFELINLDCGEVMYCLIVHAVVYVALGHNGGVSVLFKQHYIPDIPDTCLSPANG